MWCRPPPTRACCSRSSRWRRRFVVHHRRHRSFGRHGLRAHQLPRLVDRGRHARRAPRSASSACLLAGARLRRDQRAHRHLRAPAADRRDHRHRRGLSSASRLLLRPVPGGDVNEPLADALTGQAVRRRAGEPGRACWPSCCVVWVPFSRSAIGRAAYAVGSSETAAYMSGVPIDAAKFCRLYAVGPARRDRRAVSHLLHLFGRGVRRQRQHLHAVLDRRGRARRRVAVRRLGQRDRRDLRRARCSAPSATCCSSSISIRSGSRCSRASCCSPRSASARRGCSRSATGSSCFP